MRKTHLMVLGLLMIPGLASAADALTIEDFTYTTPAEAARAWQAKEGSPAPRPVEQPLRGLSFPCPFGGLFAHRLERVYWDRDAKFDLSPYTSFELDLACDDPSALRSVFVYFRSGNGYYTWSGSLPGPGRQTLIMPKKDFSTEGKPKGWQYVDRIRISPWRGETRTTALTAYALRARSDSILIVRGTASAPDPAEKRAARRAAGRLSRWLKVMDIPHGMLDDEEVSATSLASARIVILCYNPNLPAKELAALKSFVGRGGKLVVFYSADPALASLMHMRLGKYKAAERPGQWAAFDFGDAAAWHTPARVLQESWNIRPVTPAGRAAHVMAHWVDADGRRTGDPAWVASEQGLWMTHILLDDDSHNKQFMLLGLLGRLDPSIWPRAARRALLKAGEIDSFRTLEEAVQTIRRQARHSVEGARVEALLQAAQNLHTRMTLHFQKAEYPAVIQSARDLRSTLVEAYARAQSPKPGEFRGAWDHHGVGWYPGDWPRTCSELAARGMTAIFPNLAWGGVAHYPSAVLPGSLTLKRYGDQLEACARAAHAQGLQVHAWKICWNLDGAPKDFADRMAAQGRLQQSVSGGRTAWLCPSDPRNRELELAAIREIAARGLVDGLHLDYVRFPDAGTCICPACRKAFEQSLGGRVAAWPKDIRPGGRHADAWRRWRAEQITSFVRSVRATLRDVDPALQLSAAVYASYPECASSVGQDWGRWLQEGLVDFVCPMTYTEDPARFSTLTDSHLRLRGARGRVYPGLGVTAAESQLTPDKVIEGILAARRLGAEGFMLFKLDPTLRDQVLPMLELGVTRE
ncbi:MAG: family 10 glycosylhydrolase [Kiritimatiellae bacterium]|nr:family 10 glycosylhydrolase [Kiritimatiellia bacterium]